MKYYVVYRLYGSMGAWSRSGTVYVQKDGYTDLNRAHQDRQTAADNAKLKGCGDYDYTVQEAP